MHSNKKTPNTFIVGAPKCGTSAMAAYLAEHPNAFLCDPKEPFFWSEDYPRLRARNNINNLEQYLGLFSEAPDSCDILVEGSTNYLASEVAIEKIMDFDPDARFIAMFRNPVDVVHAFHSEILFAGIENEPDFEKAWHLQEQRAEGKLIPDHCEAPQFLQYADVANYPKQLERLYSLVPEANRLVILFDDFANDTAAAFQNMIEFLDLPEFEKASFEKVNASHDHRFKAFSQLVLNPPAPLRPIVNSARALARNFRGGFVDQAKSWFRKPHKRAALEARFRAELLDFFSDHIKETSRLLNRDLSDWGVDCSQPEEAQRELESVTA